MPSYRLYFLDAGAHISGPPVTIDCADDDEAVKTAKRYVDGQELELWRDSRLVARFSKKR
jgi:hypothetical protein